MTSAEGARRRAGTAERDPGANLGRTRAINGETGHVTGEASTLSRRRVGSPMSAGREVVRDLDRRSPLTAHEDFGQHLVAVRPQVDVIDDAAAEREQAPARVAQASGPRKEHVDDSS